MEFTSTGLFAHSRDRPQHVPVLRSGILPGGRRIDQRLTVVQLVPALDGGGVERGTLEIAGALHAAGHRAVVISAGGRLVPELQELGAEHIEFPVGEKSPLMLGRVPRLQRLLRELEPQIVHARSRLPAWMATFALRGLAPRPAFVTTLHGLNSVSRYSAVMTTGDRVIAVSDTARCYWLENYPQLLPERITVIHRGVDPAQFPYGYQPPEGWQESFRDAHDLSSESRLVTLPGRISRGKGHRHLIEVLPELPDDTVAVFAGGGSERQRDRLMQQARKLGVERRLLWTGHRQDIRDIMAISAVVVALGDKPESFGRVVVEALALGRPVVGFDHGGVGEILAEIYPDGRVARGDDAQLAARLRHFLNGRAPEVPERQPYSSSRMQAETLKLYQQLAAQGHVRQDPGT